MTPYSLVGGHQQFQGSCCLHLQNIEDHNLNNHFAENLKTFMYYDATPDFGDSHPEMVCQSLDQSGHLFEISISASKCEYLCETSAPHPTDQLFCVREYGILYKTTDCFVIKVSILNRLNTPHSLFYTPSPPSQYSFLDLIPRNRLSRLRGCMLFLSSFSWKDRIRIMLNETLPVKISLLGCDAM